MDPDRFLTNSLRDTRVLRTIAAALDAVEPGRLVKKYLDRNALPPHKRLFLLGIGKAAEPMVWAAADSRDDIEGILIVTKQLADVSHAGLAGLQTVPSKSGPRVRSLVGGHPIPDERSIAAGEQVLDFISSLEADDLLIILVSGGGSALAVAPAKGVSRSELQFVTDSLLSSGAAVDEVNVIRRQLDRLKGGGLVTATRASILSLILSDVIGDHLEAVASGPTVANPSNQQDALNILQKYQIQPPPSLERALRQPLPEQPVAAFERAQNIIIGNNRMALEAAQRQANLEGFKATIVDDQLRGEAKVVGQQLACTLRVASTANQRPFCLIAGGETTVTLGAHGTGGRNQELALAAVDVMDRFEGAMFMALATDGNDGPTDAAGAIAAADTRRRAADLGMRSEDYLARHDSYHFFAPLGDLLKPGYTGTNVNDVILFFKV